MLKTKKEKEVYWDIVTNAAKHSRHSMMMIMMMMMIEKRMRMTHENPYLYLILLRQLDWN